MSTLYNRNELISGCRHSKNFLVNTVLTWLVLVANLTCCKHHLCTTRHAPTPRLSFYFTWWFASQEAWTLWAAINVQDIIQSHQSISIIYIHIYPTPVNNRTVHAQEHVKCHITCNFNSFIHSFILIDSLPEKIPSSYYMPVAPNDGVLLHVLRTLFRLSRVLLDL